MREATLTKVFYVLLIGRALLPAQQPPPQNSPSQSAAPSRAVGAIVLAPSPPAKASDSASPAGPASGPSISTSAAAERLFDQFQATAWEAPYSTWPQTSRDAVCRPFSTEGRFTIPDALWAYRCGQQILPLSAEWLFYAWAPDNPPVARLEQFRASIGGQVEGDVEPARQWLANRLATRLGPGEEPGKLGVSEFGSAFWSRTRRWQIDDLQVYLYLLAVPNQPARVELMARRHPLLEALKENEKLQQLESEELAGINAGFDQELSRQLGPDFTPLFRRSSAPIQRVGEDNPAIFESLLRVLEASRSATPERLPIFLLAADRLAEQIVVTERQSPQWESQRRQLADFGLTFSWDELGGAWAYHHDLLWRVWQGYGSTPWGQHAFLALQSHGWDTAGGCANGSDQFRAVIRNGEEYLGKYPQSPIRPRIRSAIGQAYETWWSLSKAAGDDYADPSQYQEGAEAAREKAIEYYEQLLGQAASLEAGAAAPARLALPRLKLGLDTYQRRFFCVYD